MSTHRFCRHVGWRGRREFVRRRAWRHCDHYFRRFPRVTAAVVKCSRPVTENPTGFEPVSIQELPHRVSPVDKLENLSIRRPLGVEASLACYDWVNAELSLIRAKRP
jgi:hypothetical protein